MELQPFGGLTRGFIVRFAASVAFFGMGMHYLVTGRQQASLNRMAVGAALALASLLFLL
ncbi:MAG: hypothetical protein KGM24_02285 [Elusimicrobia bacterium]|nr:hypothetical protein [Elusimicrobiota bacterium]